MSINSGSKEALTAVHESTVSRGTSESPARYGLKWGLTLALVWVIGAIYTASLLKGGWIPHDEGAFAQSAERVLMGELPHRDFDLGYTGGQSYLNAFAFWLLGTNLATLRIVLFIFFLAWVPAVYAIASRFVSPPGAGAATLLALTWSVANYPAAVTSW